MLGTFSEMEHAQLAAKQKRARDWQQFIARGETRDQQLITATQEKLGLFRAALARAATEKPISSDTEQEILDLERQLEQLNEEARLAARN